LSPLVSPNQGVLNRQESRHTARLLNAAGLGLLSPVQGELLQETIDVAVVMNTLCALA